jgi:hypothetical protein
MPRSLRTGAAPYIIRRSMHPFGLSHANIGRPRVLRRRCGKCRHRVGAPIAPNLKSNLSARALTTSNQRGRLLRDFNCSFPRGKGPRRPGGLSSERSRLWHWMSKHRPGLSATPARSRQRIGWQRLSATWSACGRGWRFLMSSHAAAAANSTGPARARCSIAVRLCVLPASHNGGPCTALGWALPSGRRLRWR